MNNIIKGLEIILQEHEILLGKYRNGKKGLCVVLNFPPMPSTRPMSVSLLFLQRLLGIPLYRIQALFLSSVLRWNVYGLMLAKIVLDGGHIW